MRRVFKDVMAGWTWYDQLFLFGGIFLLILGILTFVLRRRPSIMRKSEAATTESQELLEFYERQKANWRYYVRLELVHVFCFIRVASPYLILQFKVRNFLPVEFRLVKIAKGNGTVVHPTVTQGNLPSIEKGIDKEIRRCDEDQFDLKLDIHGTTLPRILEYAAEQKATVQWVIQGEWHVNIFGQVQLAKTSADSLMYTDMPDIRD